MATNRVRTNFLGGVIENGGGLTDVGTTLQSSALAEMEPIPTNSQRTIAFITLDPFRRAGAPEVVQVTSHVMHAINATISRGQDHTAYRPHPRGTEWLQGPLVSDWDELDAGWATLEILIEEAVRRRDFSGKGQLVVGNGGTTAYGILQTGVEDTVLHARAGASLGLAWEKIGWNSLSTTLQNTLVPAGIVLPWAGGGQPFDGWLRCDGAYHAKEAYPRLDAILAAGGYPWGQSNDGSAFRVPTLNGRTLVGGVPGSMGGSSTAQITEDNLPPHTHAHDITVNPASVQTGATLGTDNENLVYRPGTYVDLEHIFGVDGVPNESATQVELFRHTHTTTGGVKSTGRGIQMSVQNPYATVQYIIKT